MIVSKIRDLNPKNHLLFIFVMCFSFFFQTLWAQENTGSLRGRITDSKQENLAAATLLLQRPKDSVYYKSTTTDTDGNYQITDIAAGEYELTVYSTGYTEQSRKIQIGNEALIVNFILEEKLEEIDQVRISRQYSRYLPTGEQFIQVRNNPLAKGQSTTDFLRFVRGIHVRGDEILVLGRSGTELYINDRPARFTELAAIPTTMIENIEIVEQAGAEYGVLGHGVIKITLREEGGLIGSQSAYVAVRTEGYAQSSVESSLQYHKGNFTIYNTFSAEHDNILSRSRQELARTKFLLRTQGNGTGYTLNDNLGVQLKINTRHTLSIYGGMGFQNSDAILSSKNNTTEVLRMESTHRALDYNAGLFYRYKIPYGQSSYFSLRSTLQHDHKNDSQLYTTNENTRSKETYKKYYFPTTLQLRLVNESGHVFNFGAHGSYLPNQRRLDGDFAPSLPGLHGISTERESFLYRAWSEYSKKFGSFVLRAGLTYYTRRSSLRDQILHRDTLQRQWGIYPNLSLRYTIDPATQSMLALSYNYAYSIPNYGYDDITPRYSNDNLYSIGNWNLNDEKLHQLQLIYYINSNWFVWYEFENVNQKIYIMTHPDPRRAGLYFTRPENVGKQFLHTLHGLCNNQFFARWNISYQLDLSYVTEKMPSKNASCFYGGVNFVNGIRISDFYLNLDLRANSPVTSLHGKEGYHYSVAGSVGHSFLADQLYVVLGVKNILHSKTTYSNDYMTRLNYTPRELIYLRAHWSFSVGKEFKAIDEEKVKMLRSDIPTLK